MRKSIAMAFVFGLMSIGASSAESSLEAASIGANWRVTLDEQGRIVKLRGGESLKPVAREPLENAIRSWVFEPGKINGKPAVTETTVYLRASPVAMADDKIGLRIDTARTGGQLKRFTPAMLPRLSVAARLPADGAIVVNTFRVTYDGDGRVTQADLAEAGTGNNLQIAEMVDRQILKDARSWRFIPERVAGVGVPATILLPLCTTYGRSPRQARNDCSREFSRNDKRLNNGEAYALEPVAKIKTDIGTHLP